MIKNMSNIEIKSSEEVEIIKTLEARSDHEAKRLLRFLKMPDLSRAKASPLYELIERLVNLPEFKSFDVVKIPDIVPAKESFDLFDFPLDHPTRSKSDTYYINDEYILRTHTTVMWYYYLLSEAIKEKLKGEAPIGVFSYGKVYRKDEIDRHHMNVFHQVDGLYLCRKNEKIFERRDLEEVLVKIAKAIFGKDIKYRFNDDFFPFTYSSIEMEIEKKDKWIEVLGAGIAQPSVLEKLGVDSKIWGG